jgi:hypothetical protein
MYFSNPLKRFGGKSPVRTADQGGAMIARNLP